MSENYPSHPQQQPPAGQQNAGGLEKNSLATPGMILGIVGVSISWIPILGFFALPLGILAVTFGGIALYKSLSTDSTLGRAQSITAIATGLPALGIWLLQLLFWGAL